MKTILNGHPAKTEFIKGYEGFTGFGCSPQDSVFLWTSLEYKQESLTQASLRMGGGQSDESELEKHLSTG